MPEIIELTDEELAMVAGGASLTGGPSTVFTGGVGTVVISGVMSDGGLAGTIAIGGGAVAAATLGSFELSG
jgi:hypothetical protein